MMRILATIIFTLFLLATSACGLLSGDSSPAPTATPEATQAPPATPMPTPSEESGDGRTYVVEEEDTLWIIAEKVYDDGSMYMKIYEANRDQLDDPEATLDVGTILVIPD
jgi:nucleoid-associated protein YgaU